MTPLSNNLLSLSEVLSIVPVSRSTWYAGMKTGRYPAPVRISARRLAWRANDIAKVIASGVAQ